jgi:hypothetical protein
MAPVWCHVCGAVRCPRSYEITNAKTYTCQNILFYTRYVDGIPMIYDTQYVNSNTIHEYTGCNRRNGPYFGRVFLMLNYIEKPQNTYIQSWTVWEIKAIETCGLPLGPRTIVVNWGSYQLVCLLAELRAREHACDGWEKCMADDSSNVHADTRMHCQLHQEAAR